MKSKALSAPWDVLWGCRLVCPSSLNLSASRSCCLCSSRIRFSHVFKRAEAPIRFGDLLFLLSGTLP